MELSPEGPKTEVQLETARLAFGEAGTGPPLVCLHNELPGASGWPDYAANVAAFASHFRTLLVDLPLFGGSSAARVGEDEAGFDALVLRDLLDHLGIERACFVGNGLGGEVAMRLAVIAPERVDRLVLIGPSGCAFSPFTPPPLEGTKAVQAYWRDPSATSMAQVLRLMTTDEELRGDAEADRRHRAALQDPEQVEVRRQRGPATGDLIPLATQIEAPSLLIWGREDRFSPIDYGLSLVARIPDAQFHMLPRCGHWANRERAEEVNWLALDFLGALG